jgi:hypothetical protein
MKKKYQYTKSTTKEKTFLINKVTKSRGGTKAFIYYLLL